MRHERTGGDERGLTRDGGRRGFLKYAAGIAGAAAATGGLGSESAAVPVSRAAGSPPPGRSEDGRQLPPKEVPFHGLHQAGIVTPQQLFAGFAAFDVLVDDRAGLTRLLQKLTERSRVLAHGVKPLDERVATEPPTPDSLTVTLGVGASLFDNRFGLAGHKPRHLTRMPSFPHDRLDPALPRRPVTAGLR